MWFLTSFDLFSNTLEWIGIKETHKRTDYMLHHHYCDNNVVKVLTTRMSYLWWGKLKKYPMNLSCKNVNSNSVKAIFTRYIDSLTLETTTHQEGFGRKINRSWWAELLPNKGGCGASLVNYTATSDFRVKTMLPLQKEAATSLFSQKKKKMVMQFLSFNSPPEEIAWHPTPVLLPGKSHGWRSLVGCSPWGR